MIVTPETPTRKRVIQADAYAADGQPDFAFSIPCPFGAEHFEHLRGSMGIEPAGLANQINQVLAENLGNNMASRIRSTLKANEDLTAAKEKGERQDESPKSLPTQEDMDVLIKSYDFSGVRLSSGESSTLTALDREILKLSKAVIRNILRESGVGGKPAPVTVARSGENPSDAQISTEDFLALVDDLVQGNGPWGEDTWTNPETGEDEASPYAAKRQEILRQAQTNVELVSSTVTSHAMKLQAA